MIAATCNLVLWVSVCVAVALVVREWVRQ